tara:strand:+ start:10 stop:432 length:423 start_codon:yes stop_codon:yes gene_type:complete
MKKLLRILVLGLLLASCSDNKSPIFIECTGIFPKEITGKLFGGSTETQLAKIDLRKRKIVFETGAEYISDGKWDTADHDFTMFRGIREYPAYGPPDSREHFSINRFTGDAWFFYSIKKKEGNIKLPPTNKLKCKRVDRKL